MPQERLNNDYDKLYKNMYSNLRLPFKFDFRPPIY